MIYTEPLPRTSEIARLAGSIRSFPTTRQAITTTAASRGFDKDTQNFLELFPPGVRFDSRDDFITRCEELELLLREEAAADEETLLSSQD